MITHCGWSVQLYLGNNRLTPFEVESNSSSVFASYAVPSESLSIGSEWFLIWRDDRPQRGEEEQEMVVGLVTELEGTAKDQSPGQGQENLVGTSISPQPNKDVYPSVKGIIRMGIAPLRLQLSLRLGQTSPLPMGSQPLATFQLVVYPQKETKFDQDGPVNPHGDVLVPNSTFVSSCEN